ncbi:hypothetical protein KKG83_07895 [Candidatus Micrarchaeota archaeon]|nr:hypothetical protein [Candidatus Micrarchaeota archaeon]MBU2477362.1 hypothetical protein [Candidatus Micrarchaeota archaeon]
MKLEFSEKAEKELDAMDKTLRRLFVKHAEKVSNMPPGRHLRFGLPFNVEEVTRQNRMVYHIEKEICSILHCFKNHKEYERWFKSFK